MSTELLVFRLEVLRQGVNEVQGVLTAYVKSQQDLKKAAKTLASVRYAASDMIARSDALRPQLEQLELDCKQRDDEAWGSALTTTLEVMDKLGPLATKLDEVKNYLDRFSRNEVGFIPNFDQGLQDEASNILHLIKDLQEEVPGGQITELEKEKESQNPRKTESELWIEYRGTIRTQAVRLFTEYFDVLGGERIRMFLLGLTAEENTSLDDLCLLAQWHLEHELSVSADLEGSPFALPGRGAEDSIPFSPLLRLGLTSWSLWGLPLEGHQWGLLVANSRLKEPRYREKFTQESVEFGEDGLRILVADVIGAIAEGPAYACSLVFLEVDPGWDVPPSGNRKLRSTVSDAERIDVVMALLRSLVSEQDGKGVDYVQFLDKLVTRWTPIRQNPPKAEDDHIRQEAVRRAELRAGLLARLPQKVQSQFDLKRQYDVKDWYTAGKVLDSLLDGEPNEESLAQSFGRLERPVKLSHLWNAAWRAVLSDQAKLQRPEIETRVLCAARVITAPGAASRTSPPKPNPEGAQ